MPSDTPSDITIGTTNIRLSAIKNVFIGSTYKLSNYYRGGNNVYNRTRLNAIPTSGKISFANFKNLTNVIELTNTFNNSTGITYGGGGTFTHSLLFNLADPIILKSINSIIFNFSVSSAIATKTQVVSLMGSFQATVNGNKITGSTYWENTDVNYTFYTDNILYCN